MLERAARSLARRRPDRADVRRARRGGRAWIGGRCRRALAAGARRGSRGAFGLVGVRRAGRGDRRIARRVARARGDGRAGTARRERRGVDRPVRCGERRRRRSSSPGGEPPSSRTRRASRCSPPSWPGSPHGSSTASPRGTARTLDVAGDALAAAVADDGAPARVARLAAIASGGDAALVWRLRDGTLDVAGSYGPIVADAELAAAANAVVEEASMGSVDGRAPTPVVTLQLGRARVRRAPGTVCARPGAGRARCRAARELRGPRRPRAPLLRAGPRRRARARAHAGAALRRGRGDLSALAGAHARDGDRARRAPTRLRPRRGLPDRRGRVSPWRQAAGSRACIRRSRMLS